jgi:hypothetical protein
MELELRPAVKSSLREPSIESPLRCAIRSTRFAFNLLIVIPDSPHNHIKFPVNGFVYNPGPRRTLQV